MGTGVQAVFVYPMNALINSQVEELEKYAEAFTKKTGQPFPIRFASYTGQLREEDREPLRENPPDMLLTNYMMLELVLTRRREHVIRDSMYANFKFLVFDELHTYRGRQGADVGLLVRRIRSKSAHTPTCIGTSATMISGDGSLELQKQQVAQVARDIFGTDFTPDQVINETLTPSFADAPVPPSDALRKPWSAPIDSQLGPETLTSYPTAIWLERRIALAEKDGQLVRNTPMTFGEITETLSAETGLASEGMREPSRGLDALDQSCQRTQSRLRVTPICRSNCISFSPKRVRSTRLSGPPTDRILTLEPGVYKGHDQDKKPIFPNVFSRGSGYAFICVYKDVSSRALIPREFNSTDDESTTRIPGYVIVGDDVWNPSEDYEQLPDSWFNVSKSGDVSIVKKYQGRVPQPIWFDEWGNCSDSPSLDFSGWFMESPLLFDPTSGQFFNAQTSEGTKLTRLGSEGRSTSTTITAFSILSRLAEHGYDPRDQKLLSFTDNRQDAALQSGHFNDFIKVVLLRSAIRQAVETVPEGSTHVRESRRPDL